MCWGVPAQPARDPHGYGFWMNGVPKVNISGHGFVAGERRMRAEILARGPIACLVRAEPLNSYRAGVIDARFEGEYSHAVEVVGWGVDETTAPSPTPYWQVRNSWGQYWGEDGFFRVERNVSNASVCVHHPLNCTTYELAHASALGIEGGCAYAVPAAWGFLDVDRRNSTVETGVYNATTAGRFWRRLQRAAAAAEPRRPAAARRRRPPATAAPPPTAPPPPTTRTAARAPRAPPADAAARGRRRRRRADARADARAPTRADPAPARCAPAARSARRSSRSTRRQVAPGPTRRVRRGLGLGSGAGFAAGRSVKAGRR